jgi:uncharacterized protein (TIGR00251 family)
MTSVEPWTVTPEGVVLAVRVTPKASRDGIDGVIKDAEGKVWLRVRITAPPEDGKANAALIRLFSKIWKLPKSSFDIISGDTARTKRVLMRGDGVLFATRVAVMLRKEGTDDDGETD